MVEKSKCLSVYGTPEKARHGFLRNLASWFAKLALQSAIGAETARKSSAFRALRSDLRGAFHDYHSPFISIDVLLTRGATKFGAVSVKHDARKGVNRRIL